jgi:hypothetical protein
MNSRKLLMEILVMLARQEPDQGANLEIAGRGIDEHLARIGLSKAVQRSELEWIKKAIGEQAKQDGSLSKFFEHIHDIINSRLSQLDD